MDGVKNLKSIGTNLKKLSPKNRVSWGLKSIVTSNYLPEPARIQIGIL